MLKTFKYRIYPNVTQQKLLQKHFDGTRFLYNLALETKNTAYCSNNKTVLNYQDLSAQLTDLKKECTWLKYINSQCLQMTLRNLDTAFINFFKGHSNFPKFKKKSNNQSFQCPQHVSIENDKIYLPKFKSGIKLVQDRTFNGIIKTVTVSKTPTNKYYVSVLVENDKSIPNKLSIQNSIGLDLGLKSFIVTSENQVYDNPKFLRKNLDKLKVLQKRLSRKTKGSNRQNQARLKVALCHEKISNQRKDFLQKLSTEIVNQYDTIIVEKLQVANMIKNHKLALSIQDAGWSTFVNFIKYKCEWTGKNFIQIGTFEPSSKMHATCGYINKELTLKDREWICPICNVNVDRDLNAAINIKNFGLRNTGKSITSEGVELSTLVGTMKRQKFLA